jgi:mannan endo-1,4-beta-mannosidase
VSGFIVRVPEVDRRSLLLAAGALLAGCTAPSTTAPPTGKAPVAPSSMAAPQGPRVPTGPADPAATPDARKLLAWLAALPGRAERRVVSGQQITEDAPGDYQRLFRAMNRDIGHSPALIGVSYDGYWNKRIVPVLIDHWRAGGLVALDLHRPNPFLGSGDPESYRIDPVTTKPDLTALLAGAKPSAARSRWRTDMERLGDVMQELAEAGVTVIFRPLHEANGLWFWWGQDEKTQKSASVELYRDIHAYLTQERRLHNILWGYSPAKPWNAPRMRYYPGDDVIDIMGPTIYENTIRFGLDGQTDDISDMTEAGRPMALLEVGSVEPHDGSWDASSIISRIRERYQQLTMFNCWHGWYDKGERVKMSLVEVRDTDKLMNDPWVVSLENIDWRG